MTLHKSLANCSPSIVFALIRISIVVDEQFDELKVSAACCEIQRRMRRIFTFCQELHANTAFELEFNSIHVTKLSSNVNSAQSRVLQNPFLSNTSFRAPTC